MIENYAKTKMKNNIPVTMVFLESSYPGTAEVLAIAGCDLICIDNEHGSFTEEQMLNTIRAVHLHNKNVILRTTCTDPNMLAHYMDLGLDGVFISMIDDAAACERVIDGVKFGPIGKRAVCFNTRASDYMMNDLSVEEYLRKKNQDSLIFVNIEKKSAVDDLDKILNMEQIDSVQTGIWDLASSYGYDGHAEAEFIQNLNTDIINRAQMSGKHPGYNIGKPSDVSVAQEKGYDVMILGGEYNFISNYMKACVSELNK